MENKTISVILPCLNEEKGIGICLSCINNVFERENLIGEVIVVDNGCTDNTVKIAESFGPNVKIVKELDKGYGNAYRAGFREAKGDFVIMGDADGTYDFNYIPEFLNSLNEFDLVIGSRFKGNMTEGAMPWLHRYVGNPFFVLMLNKLYGLNLSEPSTGFVALKKEVINNLNLKSTGMEFASELLIKAKKNGFNLGEIPINYDLRYGNSKLRTFRDGFRHLNLIISERIY